MADKRQDWLSVLQRERAIAVLRSPDLETGRQMAKAAAAGGIRLLEVTWNSAQPAELLKVLQQELPDCQIGAGTLLQRADLEEAIAAGASFLFSPHTSPALIHAALEHETPIIPGALSATEIVMAWQAGATAVKVFPIQCMGGVAYLRSLREPLGNIPLIPTGGVTPENAGDFLAAGAVAVGLSGQLFEREAIAQKNWQQITQRATQLMAAVSRCP